VIDLEVRLMEKIEAETPVEISVDLNFDDSMLDAEAPVIVELELEA
jgi:hypothetical protein